MTKDSISKDEPRIDNVIFDIEDYIGGNIEGVEKIDRMGLTIFLRGQLETLQTQVAKEILEMIGEDDSLDKTPDYKPFDTKSIQLRIDGGNYVRHTLRQLIKSKYEVEG